MTCLKYDNFCSMPSNLLLLSILFLHIWQLTLKCSAYIIFPQFPKQLDIQHSDITNSNSWVKCVFFFFFLYENNKTGSWELDCWQELSLSLGYLLYKDI